jgi:hypothetical protein
MARPSFYPSKTRIRFVTAAALLLSAAPAAAQDIALKVTPAELKVIAKALDGPKIRAQT